MRNKATLFTVLLFAFCVNFAFAQTSVSGIVKSADSGEPLPGVAVVEKGTNNGTVTNFEGKFDLTVSSNTAMLVFSSLGMETKEVQVSASFMVVNLNLGSSQLDEVTVTAIGLEKTSRSLGYGVQEVAGGQVRESNETNVVQGLAAKVAGVQITQSSGAAGGASYIRIRGNSTFTSNDNQPLFVVDGVPINNNQNLSEDLRAGVALSNRAIDINPDDIESISVLKGGAAASLYGTRGANGVILITTKKGGFNQKLSVTFNSTTEMLQVNKLPELQTTYAQGVDDRLGAALGVPAGYYGGTSIPFSWGPKISDLPDVNSYDNADIFFQNGFRFNNSATVSGGSDRTNYFLSVSNFNEQGVIPLNSFNRTTIRLTGTGIISKQLSVTGSLVYTNSNGRRIQQGSNVSGLMLGLLRTPPSFDNSNGVTDPSDEASYLNPDGTQRNYRAGGGYDNPYWTINQNPFRDKVNRIFGYVEANYAPTEWLSFKYRFGVDTYSDRRRQQFAIGSRNAPAGRLIEDTYLWTEYNQDLIATASKSWGKLSGNILAGFNVNQRDLDNVYVQGDNFSIADYYNLANSSSVIATQGATRRRLMGAYAEAQLSWDNYFFVTLGARRDQSSTFGDVSQSIFYPSTSVGWVFTDMFESLKGNKVLSYGKLRFSWAKVGIEPAFGTNRTYFSQAGTSSGWIEGTSFPYLGNTGFTLSNAAGNPNLRPEFTVTTEYGFDLRFFNNRLGVDFTYYDKRSKDLLVAVPVSGTSGFENLWQNIGEMSNKGIEIVANARIVDTKKITWDATVNFTRNRNMVERLAPGVEVISLPWGFFGANQRLMEGQPYGTLYSDDWVRDANGNALVDESGYPLYSSVEVAAGDPNPDWLMGFNNVVSVGNWTFNMLWDIRQGGDIWNGTRGALYYFGTHADVANGRGEEFVWEDVVAGNNGVYAPGTVINGVDVSGQANTTRIIRDGLSYAAGPLSSFTGAARPFIEDGSWVRLRQIGVSYNLGLNSSYIKSLDLSFNVRNALLFTNYSGIDPETNLSGSTNSQGADYFNMPNTRGFIFGVKANF